MFKQTTNGSPERSNWLDTVARAAIDVFNVPHSDDEKSANKTAHNDNYSGENAKSSMWLVAPLVSKLPSAIQGRILRVAGQVLETTNFFNSTKKLNDEPNEDSNESNEQMERIKSETPQMSHQAFLGLILTCLKGQDEQKEGLLSSLYSQLSQFLQSVNNVNVSNESSANESALGANESILLVPGSGRYSRSFRTRRNAGCTSVAILTGGWYV